METATPRAFDSRLNSNSRFCSGTITITKTPSVSSVTIHPSKVMRRVMPLGSSICSVPSRAYGQPRAPPAADTIRCLKHTQSRRQAADVFDHQTLELKQRGQLPPGRAAGQIRVDLGESLPAHTVVVLVEDVEGHHHEGGTGDRGQILGNLRIQLAHGVEAPLGGEAGIGLDRKSTR